MVLYIQESKTSVGLNRVRMYTWRWEQSKLPKRSIFILEYLMMDQANRKTNTELSA